MKKIYSGSLTIGLFAAVGIWANAQSANWVYVEAPLEDPIVLSGAQKAAVGTAINNSWEINAADLLSLNCSRRPTDLNTTYCIRCRGVELSDDEYLQKRKDGLIKAGETIVAECDKTGVPFPGNVAEYSAITNDVFGLSLQELYSFTIYRDEETPTTVLSNRQKLVTDSALNTVTEDKAGNVALILGQVE